MDFPHGETVTRLRATVVEDRYGNVTLDWTTPATLVIPGCAVADGGSLEPLQDARDQVVSDFDVLAPFGVDILAGDRVVIRGLTCEVQGRPFDWSNPFTGWQPGRVVKAKIWEG